MDYQYDFRQAYQNRLEETGIASRRAKVGVRAAQNQRPRKLTRRNRLMRTSIFGLFPR